MKSEIVVFWKSKVPQFHSETTLPLEAQYIGCEGRKVFLPLSSSVSPFFLFYALFTHFDNFLHSKCAFYMNIRLGMFLTFCLSDFLKSYFAYFLTQFKQAIGLARKTENLINTN